MKKWQLTEKQKEKLIRSLILLLGFAVLSGQVVETKAAVFHDILSSWRLYVDPAQYMIGMLALNLTLVVAAVYRHAKYPNPLLNTFKWYFAIMFCNDFLILVLRAIQDSNVIVYTSGMAVGIGNTYLMLGSVRGILDLTLTAAATLLVVRGLTNYRPGDLTGSSPKAAGSRLRTIITAFLLLQWFFAIPVNMGVFLRSRAFFNWSLALSQIGQVVVAVLIYWVVKELHRKHRTDSFRYLSRYYGLGVLVAGLVFTYSMGSFGLLQRFPAGESQMPGGFGQFVFYISRLAYIYSNYLMFQALHGYEEQPGSAAGSGLDANRQAAASSQVG